MAAMHGRGTADKGWLVSTIGLVRELETLVGDDHVIASPSAGSSYLSDFRGLFAGRAAAVVKPATVEQVADVVRLCQSRGHAIIPHGGNTGLCGGTAPSSAGGDVILCLERMTRVRAQDVVNNTITVEAGCILHSLQEHVSGLDRYFPLSLGAEGSCQIGGNIATNAGGHSVLRYGNMRDLVLGLEAVLPDGSIFNDLRGLRKNNTGYDLKQLFIGSEGTLGIVTAATLKLFPARRQIETAFVALRSLDDLMEVYQRAQKHADEFLSAFEMVPRIGLQMAIDHVPEVQDPLDEAYPFYALIELSSSQIAWPLRPVLDGFLEALLVSGAIRDGIISSSLREAQSFWRIREACVEAQRLAGPSFKHDVSMPIDRIPAFIRDATWAIERRFPAVQVVAFGHIGDGNIHFNVCCGREQEETFLTLAGPVEDIVYEAVASVGGSFSAEHGIGLLKRDALLRYTSPDALRMMVDIKGLIDPNNILNPGKVLSPATVNMARDRKVFA